MNKSHEAGNKIAFRELQNRRDHINCLKISDASRMNFEDFAERIWISVNGKKPVDIEDREYISWKESLPRLIQVVQEAGLGNIILAAECELPTGGRVDAVLLGYAASDHKPLAVFIELKQWSREGIELYDNGYTSIRVHSSQGDYQSIHPIRQIDGYIKYMERNHSGVIEGRLSVRSCQYLFNYDVKEKDYLFSRDFKRYQPFSDQMFCKGEETRFQNFLSSLFSNEDRDASEALSIFFDSKYQMTDLDMEVFRDITSQGENISLIEDQIPITECINMAVRRLLIGNLGCHVSGGGRTTAGSAGEKRMFLISGAAGTEKTIVGFKILSDYCQMYQEIHGDTNYKCAYTLPRSRTIKAILDGIGGGMQTVFLNNLKGNYDLMVVDEAHRVTDFNTSSGGVGNALNRARIVVVLQDDKQRVLGNEIGTADRYKEFAGNNGFSFQSYKLNLQKRAGFGGYVESIDKLLYGEKADKVKEAGLKIKICDTLSEMEHFVNEKYQTNKSIKYYAPNCWKWKSRYAETAMDIVIPEERQVFQKQWNPYLTDRQFSWYTDSVDQVGCIYTVQGLGYDYVALIWWDDLKWDKIQNKWIVDLGKVTSCDTLLKHTINDGADYDYIILNIYRVLLTRAKKGIYIWFKDQDTRDRFNEIVMPASGDKI